MTHSAALTERHGLGRRTVVRSAVWTVPVIAAAAAAPAYAASCARASVTWSDYGDGTVVASGTTGTIGGVGVTLTYSGATGAANNAKIYSATQTGGLSSALRFYDQNTSSTSQTIRFTFSRAVRNLNFSLLDVDSATNAYSDQVSVAPAGFTFTRGSTVQGDGTNAAFRATGANTSVSGSSATGNVELFWSAAVTMVTLTYAQYSGTVNGSPFIGVSDLSFQPVSC